MKISNFTSLQNFLNISQNLKTDFLESLTVNEKLTENNKNPFVNDLKQWQNNDKIVPYGCPKWNLDRIPLKFFVYRNVENEKFSTDFVNMAKASFKPWSRASYGLIRFQEVFNKNDADIIVDWSDKVTYGRDFETGHSNLEVVHNRIKKAEITIVIYPEIDRMAKLSSRVERVKRTAVHEIGHALGLNHSNNSRDVMFYRGINNKGLSSNDIRRLNELYSKRNQKILV